MQVASKQLVQENLPARSFHYKNDTQQPNFRDGRRHTLSTSSANHAYFDIFSDQAEQEVRIEVKSSSEPVTES